MQCFRIKIKHFNFLQFENVLYFESFLVGMISSEDLEQVPENSTVVMGFYDHELIDVAGSKYSSLTPSSDKNGMRMVKHTRIADFFSASIVDPQGEVIDTVGVNFTLSFIRGQKPTYSDGKSDNYIMSNNQIYLEYSEFLLFLVFEY